MFCENKFCLYWKENECVLNEIELDICGMCKSCIYIEISKAELEKKRKEQFQTEERIIINIDSVERYKMINNTAEKIIDENLDELIELSK